MTETNFEYTPETNTAFPPPTPTMTESQPIPPAPQAPVNQAYAPTYVAPVPQAQTNGMAIAGLICAFLISPLGLIFSIIGLNKSKQMNGEGRGLSIAGIVISVIGIVLSILYVVFMFWLIGTVDTIEPTYY